VRCGHISLLSPKTLTGLPEICNVLHELPIILYINNEYFLRKIIKIQEQSRAIFFLAAVTRPSPAQETGTSPRGTSPRGRGKRSLARRPNLGYVRDTCNVRS
jgi:hypothetical protein